MPKLSQQTLEKRFQCPYCGITLRTRPGLSGHIQFKHPKGTASTGTKSTIDAITEVIILRRSASEPVGISDAELEEMAEIRADWHFIKDILRQENIKLNDTDYKTYMFISAALMYGNHRLINKLNKDLGSAIGQLLEINAQIGSKS